MTQDDTNTPSLEPAPAKPKIWHYLVAGYVGVFIWMVLAGLGGLVWGTSGIPVQRQIVIILVSTPFISLTGLLYALLFRRMEPILIMLPRRLSAPIFWMAICAIFAVFTNQMNISDYRFYIGFVIAAVSGLCFELVLSALKGRRRQPCG